LYPDPVTLTHSYPLYNRSGARVYRRYLPNMVNKNIKLATGKITNTKTGYSWIIFNIHSTFITFVKNKNSNINLFLQIINFAKSSCWLRVCHVIDFFSFWKFSNVFSPTLFRFFDFEKISRATILLKLSLSQNCVTNPFSSVYSIFFGWFFTKLFWTTGMWTAVCASLFLCFDAFFFLNNLEGLKPKSTNMLPPILLATLSDDNRSLDHEFRFELWSDGYK